MMDNAGSIQTLVLRPEVFLSKTEVTALGSFKFPHKKQGLLIGRLAAKRALAALFSEADLSRIEIHAGAFEQPVISHSGAANFGVTLSHSPGIAVALAYPVGFPIDIDIETVSADKADGLIGEMSISDTERAWLNDANQSLEIACGVL